MSLGARNLSKIEANSFKEVESALVGVRQNYTSGIEPISHDAQTYHVVAFHKFAFSFHKVLSDLLKVDSKMTTTELLEQFEALTSNNFKLNKKIKKKEDELLMESDKEKFQAVKAELEKMIRQKNYFTTLEKNVIKHNLIFELRLFINKVDEMEFSGDPIEKDDVLKVFKKCNKYVTSLTSVDMLKEAEDEYHMGINKLIHSIAEKFFGKKDTPMPVPTKTDSPPGAPANKPADKPLIKDAPKTNGEATKPAENKAASPKPAPMNSTAIPSTGQEKPKPAEVPKVEEKPPLDIERARADPAPMVTSAPSKKAVSDEEVIEIKQALSELPHEKVEKLISFIKAVIGKYPLETIKGALLKTGWPANYVELVMPVLHKNHA